jgi:hypothetical protein
MPLLQKIISSKEIGLVIQLASFVMHMKQSIIYSLVALLPSLSGALLLLPLILPRALGVSPNFFGGFPNLSLLARNTQIAGLAAICWSIWKLRNRACFENKLISSPAELINYAVVFMKYWSGLHGEQDALELRAGADGLLRLATSVGTDGASSGSADNGNRLRLENRSPDDRNPDGNH